MYEKDNKIFYMIVLKIVKLKINAFIIVKLTKKILGLN